MFPALIIKILPAVIIPALVVKFPPAVIFPALVVKFLPAVIFPAPVIKILLHHCPAVIFPALIIKVLAAVIFSALVVKILIHYNPVISPTPAAAKFPVPVMKISLHLYQQAVKFLPLMALSKMPPSHYTLMKSPVLVRKISLSHFPAVISLPLITLKKMSSHCTLVISSALVIKTSLSHHPAVILMSPALMILIKLSTNHYTPMISPAHVIKISLSFHRYPAVIATMAVSLSHFPDVMLLRLVQAPVRLPLHHLLEKNAYPSVMNHSSPQSSNFLQTLTC